MGQGLGTCPLGGNWDTFGGVLGALGAGREAWRWLTMGTSQTEETEAEKGKPVTRDQSACPA